MRLRFTTIVLFCLAAMLAMSSCVKRIEGPGEPEKPETTDPGEGLPIIDAGLFSGGDGSEDHPYLIGKAADLVVLSSFVSNSSKAEEFNSKHYRQTADIDLSLLSNFAPIGPAPTLNFKGLYDGDNHKIINLSITQDTDGGPAALFGMLGNGAVVKNVCIEGLSIKSTSYYTGAIAGAEEYATIENCTVTGAEISNTGAPAEGLYKNCALTGGIVGLADEGAVRGCKFSGTVYGSKNHVGGIVGEAVVSSGSGVVSVIDCEFSGNVSTSYYVAGIVGYGRGGVSVRGCSVRGLISGTGNYAGGMVSYMGRGEIRDCVFSSAAEINLKMAYAGGMVGYVYGVGDASVTIDNCACYGAVHGLYCTGGIAGCVQNKEGDSFTLTNCMASGCDIRSTGENDYHYQLAGGVVGYAAGKGNCTYANSLANAETVSGTIAAGGGMGGFTGYISQANSFINCAVCMSPSDVLYNNAPIAYSSNKLYGVFFGRSTGASTMTACYASDAAQFGPVGKETRTGCRSFSVSAMTDGTLLGALNSGVATVSGAKNWSRGADAYPVITGIPADPDVKQGRKLRVSIIGDSISTFAGWQPNSYTNHYPNANNCDVTSVDKTWWHRLIYQYLPSARLDMNISFSNSTVVANSYGDATAYWYGHDFCSRYIECNGMGRPDVIVIHGGTNDYSHNYGECLAGNIPMRNASMAPSDVMNALYSAADACKTIGEARNLDSSTFCASYIKLVRMMQLQYPSVKIICIVGDHIGSDEYPALRPSILDIANHYKANCRAVDFVALTGWRSSEAPFSKYSGAHPDAAGMDYMARTIYSQLGGWLAE